MRPTPGSGNAAAAMIAAAANAWLDAEAADSARIVWADTTLEKLAESRDLGKLAISRAQRALIRATLGLPTALSAEESYFHFGVESLPSLAKATAVIVRCGVRSGKSLIAALAMIDNAMTCQLRWEPPLRGEIVDDDGLVGVRPGELVRILLVAPLMSLARAPLKHLLSTLLGSDRMARYVHSYTAETIQLRRDDGVIISVELVAASAGGATLRSTWLAGIVFDEADFHNDEGAAVNLEENYRAVVPRMLRGAQIWIVSSPYSDSSQFGLMFSAAWGPENGRDGVVAFHSDSMSMNPLIDRDEVERLRKRDPDNVAREYDAVPRTSASMNFFDPVAIAACCSLPDDVLPPNDAPHWAGADLGFSKNSATLALARAVDGKTVLAYWKEHIPEKGSPLSPKVVCQDFGKRCNQYTASIVRGDRWYYLTAIDEFGALRADVGKAPVYEPFDPSNKNQAEAFTEFRRRMNEGLLRLPNNEQLKREMKDTKSKVTAGSVGVVLPSHGRRHADLLMAVVLACVQVPPRAPGHVERRMLMTNPLPF